MKNFSIEKMANFYAAGDYGYLDLHSPILANAKHLANEFINQSQHSQKQQIVPL